MTSSSPALFVATATAAIGVVVASILVLQWKQGKRGFRQGKKDVLDSVLAKSAPVAAAEELADAGSATCERLLDGRQFVITADASVADYIFNGHSKGNYVRRPAVNEGLKALGMLNRGLIWNNELPTWRKVRGCFQRALGEATLSRAVITAGKECRELLAKAVVTTLPVSPAATPVNLLGVSRKVTFRVTLTVFFGIDSKDFGELQIHEDTFIASIVDYFKAWEFFLLRPQHSWHAERVKVHTKAVDALCRHVKQLLTATKPNHNNRHDPLFVDNLRLACQEHDDPTALLEQSTLEMLLAGTDTSSVTAYYALLGLAGDTELQRELRDDLVGASSIQGKSALLDSIINETLRFKPVGPVVLREAVKADPDFPGPPIKQGAAVLVHLAEMNLRDAYWQDPKMFHPKRFLGRTSKKKIFFPFGEGPKGCIGMHLGRREVNAIIESVVLNFDLTIEGCETLGSLETHWDIANQPDKPARILVSRVVKP